MYTPSVYTSVVLFLVGVGTCAAADQDSASCETNTNTCGCSCDNVRIERVLSTDLKPPASVIVYYDFSQNGSAVNPSLQKVWFWASSSSSPYHLQPRLVLWYTSLFFAKSSETHLMQELRVTLDLQCANASDGWMQKLTQDLIQVKLSSFI